MLLKRTIVGDFVYLLVNGDFSAAGLRYPDTYASYQNYEHYPPPTRPEYPYSNAAAAYGAGPAAYPTYGEGVAAAYGDHPPTPPSPSERSESPPQQHALAQGNCPNISIYLIGNEI